MKRLLAALLAVMLVCSMNFPAFAAEEEKENNVTVKYVTTVKGAYVAPVQNGVASINADGVSVSVTDAPSNAKTLVAIRMTGDALSWIDSCVDGEAKAAYDIHFEDTEGNRISANGANVSVSVSGSELTVSSVNTSGTDKNLSSTTSGSNVSFATDGSNYYVVWEKKSGGETADPGETITVPIRGDENEIHADVTVDGDTVELHELDFEEIDHIVGDKDKDGLIEIDLTKLDEDVCKIILPVTSIEHITSEAEETHNEHEALQVDFPHGSVKLDDKTMQAIVEQAECNEVILVLEDVGETRLNEKQENAVKDWNVYGGYEAYLLCVKANKRISDFEGGVATFSVPFTIPSGYSAGGFSVWYVSDNGDLEKLHTWYTDGKLCWDVSHFSDFIIAYKSVGEDTNDDHYVNVKDPTGGDVGVSDKTPETGDTVTITPKPDNGKEVDKVIVKDEDDKVIPVTNNGDGTYSFTQPDSDVTVEVVFRDKPAPDTDPVKPDVPPTGDNSHVGFWLSILIASALGLFFLIFWKRKKNTSQE